MTFLMAINGVMFNWWDDARTHLIISKLKWCWQWGGVECADSQREREIYQIELRAMRDFQRNVSRFIQSMVFSVLLCVCTHKAIPIVRGLLFFLSLSRSILPLKYEQSYQQHTNTSIARKSLLKLFSSANQQRAKAKTTIITKKSNKQTMRKGEREKCLQVLCVLCPSSNQLHWVQIHASSAL